jgi:hypothetical protein
MACFPPLPHLPPRITPRSFSGDRWRFISMQSHLFHQTKRNYGLLSPTAPPAATQHAQVLLRGQVETI